MTIVPTARVQVIGRNKQIQSKSIVRHRSPYQCSYSESLQDTGIRTKTFNERIIGVNQKDSMPVDGSLKLEFIPKTGENITLNCLVLKTITASENPNQPLSETDYADLINYNLADNQFWQPGEIDILLRISAYTHNKRTNTETGFLMPHRNYARLDSFRISQPRIRK